MYNNEVITIVMKTPYNGSSVRDLNVYKGRGWGQKSDFYYHEKQYKNQLPTKNTYQSLKVTFVQPLQVTSFTFALKQLCRYTSLPVSVANFSNSTNCEISE